jgi:hypothetical protein
MFRNVYVAAGRVILGLAFCGHAVAAGLAQPPPQSTATGATPGEAVTLEPIECWSRISTGAVRVGELFTLVVTCSVVDTASTTVVPDQSRLDPGVFQIPPFEVVSGTQANDLRTATRRFFQYEYTVRYVGEDFGKDISLPSLTVSYHVQTRVQQGPAIEGRELQYILPARMIRILSLVPGIATDIRDQPPETFRQIEARRFRANVLRVIAGFLFIVGALVLISGLTRVFRRRKHQPLALNKLTSVSAILRRLSEELGDVRRLRGTEGWTDALGARALAALRVVATYAVSRPVNQVPGHGIQPSDGQLVVPGRWLGRNAALISGSATSTTLAEARRVIETGRAVSDVEAGGARVSSVQRLADLDHAMSRLSSKAYGRDAGAIKDADLDDALDVGGRELDRLRREHTWLAKKLRALGSALERLRVRLKPDATVSRLRDRA